ncbi:MAG TPA: hypothetical protein VHN10_06700, partial [Candidatus Acidoferrales bacterium]|nr:hypothetical protein [Candidatus Acidoferrales bacterium]
DKPLLNEGMRPFEASWRRNGESGFTHDMPARKEELPNRVPMYCASTSIQMQKNSDVLLFNSTPPLIREERFTEQTLLNSEG